MFSKEGQKMDVIWRCRFFPLVDFLLTMLVDRCILGTVGRADHPLSTRGDKMPFRQEVLNILLAPLFQDCGKVDLPEQVLWRPAKGNEWRLS